MFLDEPPMGLGETLTGTQNSTLVNSGKLGQVHYFPASNLDAPRTRGDRKRKTGKQIKAVCLRNTSGFALLPKQIVQLSTTAGFTAIETADGYAAVLGQPRCCVVDEFLPSTGVADDDIFWGIIGGPVRALVTLTGAGMNGDIAVGNPLVAATGTTSGATTAGRVSNIAFIAATSGQTGAALQAYTMGANHLGIALSAKTTGETTAGQDVLIDMFVRY